MEAARRASTLRPLQERTKKHTREQQVEAFLTSRHYILFPGTSWDLTDPAERVHAKAWLLELLEEVGV